MTAGEAPSSTADPIRVLLVDDDTFVHAGLNGILNGAEGIVAVGSRTDGSQLMAAIAELRPDVVLVDVRMPGLDGVAAVELARGLKKPPRFIMMTSFDDGERVLDSIAAGADGFILKSDGPNAIIGPSPRCCVRGSRALATERNPPRGLGPRFGGRLGSQPGRSPHGAVDRTRT